MTNIFFKFMIFIIFVIFVLFFSIIGVNKKLIDSIEKNDDSNEIQKNINSVRGLIWTNYFFITVSLIISLYFIISKKYYLRNKWIVLFSILFILLNTGLTVYEEIILQNVLNSKKISSLNNIYIITCIMSFVFFILIVKLNLINKMYYEIDSLNIKKFNRFNRFVMNNPFHEYSYEDSVTTPSSINYDIEDVNNEIFDIDKIYRDDDNYIYDKRRNVSF